MKYKVGDKIKIRSWEEIELEYKWGETDKGNCKAPFGKEFFTIEMERKLNRSFPDRILTIKQLLSNDAYFMEETFCDYKWENYMIEGAAKNYIASIPIENRWEILDL